MLSFFDCSDECWNEILQIYIKITSILVWLEMLYEFPFPFAHTHIISLRNLMEFSMNNFEDMPLHGTALIQVVAECWYLFQKWDSIDTRVKARSYHYYHLEPKTRSNFSTKVRRFQWHSQSRVQVILLGKHLNPTQKYTWSQFSRTSRALYFRPRRSENEWLLIIA